MPADNQAMPLPMWRQGQPLHRSHINQLVQHANALASITGGPGVNVTRTGNGVTISLEPAAVQAQAAQSNPFVARIISSSDGAHAWAEQRVLDGAFTTLPDGRNGTTSANPAYEVNGRTEVPPSTLVWIHMSPGTDGSTQYTFDVGAGSPGTTMAMNYTGEHGEDEVTTTWDINDQSTSRGVVISVMTGQRYDAEAETPVLYAFMRDLIFDAQGQLVAVAAERRVTIDTPEACP